MYNKVIKMMLIYIIHMQKKMILILPGPK